MKVSGSKLNEFKKLFFLGKRENGDFAMDACYDLELTAKLIKISLEDAEYILEYLTDLAKRKNDADIDLATGISNASDSDLINYFIRVKDFDITKYLDELGNIDIVAIGADGYGDLIESYELTDKDVTKLKMLPKIEAIKQIQLIKEKQKDNAKLSDKIKAITFFDDSEIDLSILQKELDTLKNQ